MKTATASAQQNTDYELSAVPANQRKSFFSLTIVWTGFVFVITSMMAGGGLAAGLNFKDIILATFLGNLFLSAIAILVSVIACKTGLTFALITRYSFGAKGTRLASLFVPIVNLGWYTIQSATYGHFIAQIFDFGPVAEGITMMYRKGWFHGTANDSARGSQNPGKACIDAIHTYVGLGT